ncbi:MAG: hypothetical protein EXR80_09785 [Methylococcales bacterium]|nr:hypothetical protein [Methylococcales bacterium]
MNVVRQGSHELVEWLTTNGIIVLCVSSSSLTSVVFPPANPLPLSEGFTVGAIPCGCPDNDLFTGLVQGTAPTFLS